MSNPHGSWIWYELMTADPAASKAFYDGILGWDIEAQPSMPGDTEYRMINAQDGMAGGVLTLSQEMLDGGGRPGWYGYIGVDDVDATAQAVAQHGGSIHIPPSDIPGVGRFAMVADPQGVPFYIMRGNSPEDSTAYQRMGMQHVSWNELQTSDDRAGFDFYSAVFGWQKDGGMPMPWGEYAFLRTGADPQIFGAMMPRQDDTHPTVWNFYFRAPDADAAHAKVKELGGTPYSDPMEVPGGERVFQATDPHGIVFGIVAPR
jgi:uncharacterized protein